jgi:spore coat protein U-like protein
MKNVLFAALLGLGLAAHGSAFAADSAQNFTVSVSLTPACVLGTVGGIAFTYTGAQATPAAGSGGGFSLLCTANLPYSFALDNDASNATGTATSRTYVDAATLLAYTLTTPAAGSGTGTSQSLSLSGTMGPNQGGSCPSAVACDNTASTNRSRTLTVSY